MINKQIESLLFEAIEKEHGQKMTMRFHEMSNFNTANNEFEYNDSLGRKTKCSYDSLRLVEPEEIVEKLIRAAEIQKMIRG